MEEGGEFMFRSGRRSYVIAGIVFTVVLASAIICHADFTPPTLDTSAYAAVAGAVFAAIAGIWGLRKVIKLLNRS